MNETNNLLSDNSHAGKPWRLQSIELKSAERRFAVVMALFAVAVAVRLVSNDATYWNFPCNSPCPHTTFFARPMLDYLIFSWLMYAGFSFLYFSPDYFQKLAFGESIRKFFGRVATVLLYLYPGFVVYIALVLEGSYFLPSWAQGGYWFFADDVLGLMILVYTQTLVGRSLFRPYFANTHTGLGLVSLGMRIQGGNLHYNVLKLVAMLRGGPFTVQEFPAAGKYRLEVLSIIGALLAITGATTWSFTSIRGWWFLGVVDTVLVGYMIFSAFIGWGSRRSELKRKNSELKVPKDQWFRFRTNHATRLLARISRSRTKSHE